MSLDVWWQGRQKEEAIADENDGMIVSGVFSYNSVREIKAVFQTDDQRRRFFHSIQFAGMQPALVFELAPAFGFLLCITTLTYLFIMRSKQSDVFAVVYALQFIDALLGFSLFYAGFHGSAVVSKTDDNTLVQTIDCAWAVHLSLWCWMDVASAAILLLLCLDQLVSIIWTKTHKTICSFYMQPAMMLLLCLLSCAILKPAWSNALETADNTTVLISPFCSMRSVFDDDFYDLDLAIRLLTPLAGMLVLFAAAALLLIYQILCDWNFKWSDNNRDSMISFSFATLRCALQMVGVHLPVWILHNPRLEDVDEICLRMIFAGVMSVLQPIGLFWLFPDYWKELKRFFSKYSHDTKRTWQSANDPPPADKTIGGLDFGSWYSSAGNIVGECGVPYDVELDADKQRSISFYYNEMDRY